MSNWRVFSLNVLVFVSSQICVAISKVSLLRLQCQKSSGLALNHLSLNAVDMGSIPTITTIGMLRGHVLG